jgi:hypothetical protein
MKSDNAMHSRKSFTEIVTAAKEEYQTWEPLWCPTLNTHVHFGMRGFNHLQYRVRNARRTAKETLYKIALLMCVRSVITTATEVEYRKRISPVGGTREIVYKKIEYYALTAAAGEGGAQVRVVLRKLSGSDQFHFWSVMKSERE